jgi:hypothetical protein
MSVTYSAVLPVHEHAVLFVSGLLHSSAGVGVRANGWLGEVQGLQISLDAARAKLVSLDRTSRSGESITQLGILMIRNE